MSDIPLVSIVVPTFNHAAFVVAALESVVAQTYPRLELIVWDDCSSDGTETIARAYLDSVDTRGFERVDVKSNPYNRGAHETLNEAVLFSAGDYVSLLNSDDLYGPNRIVMLMDALRAAGSELAFSGVACIDDEGEPLGAEVEKVIPIGAAARASVNCPTISFGFLGQQMAISTGNLVFRRALYDRIGGFIPLRYCHDWDFVLQSIIYTEPVYVPEALYEYRIHGSNSFKSLSAIASLESEIVLTRYFKRLLYGQVKNDRAPSPRNWPGIFEQYLSLFGSGELWKTLRRGHVKSSRTVTGA